MQHLNNFNIVVYSVGNSLNGYNIMYAIWDSNQLMREL